MSKMLSNQYKIKSKFVNYKVNLVFVILIQRLIVLNVSRIMKGIQQL